MTRSGRPAAKRLRNIGITIATLLILFIAVGVGYTWYSGQNTPLSSKAIQAPVTPISPISTVKTSTPAGNAKEGASVESITSPVSPGDNVAMEVRTLPGSTCTVAVNYNSVPSKDSGLTAKTADEFGIVDWSWTVDGSAAIGTWPMKATCSRNKQVAVVQADLTVVAPQ